MLAKVVKTSTVALIVLAVTAATASAGKYHAYTCRKPSGAAAPADGWIGRVAFESSYDTYARNTCAEGGSLLAALGEETVHGPKDEATWELTVPAAEKLTAATIWRASRGYFRSGEKGVYQMWLAGPTEPEVFDSCIASSCSGQGVVGTPFAASNRVAVPSANLGAHLYANANCFVPLSGECGHGFGDPNGFAAAEYVYAADLVLEQTEIPSAGTPSGPLVTETPIHGTSDIIFTASDPGAGIYKAVFNVDGNVVQENVINENEGRCKNVGETTDGLPAFLYLQPCPKSVSADVGLDTTKLTNGHHHIIVTVTDAAGNSAFVLDREVEVRNTTPPIFEWKVNGSVLGSGVSKEYTAKAGPAGAAKTFVLKGKVGVEAVKIESTKLKVNTGATIIGGNPGSGKETLKLEEVKVSKPLKCEVKGGTITTKALNGEIVESAVEESKVKIPTEKAELLFSPATGSTVAEFEFIGSECILKSDVATLEGNALAEVLPQKEEAETVRLTVIKSSSKEPYRTTTGSFGAAQLKLDTKASTLEGEAELTLTSKEHFGAF